MRKSTYHFVAIDFWVLPKTQISIFLFKKRSQTLRELDKYESNHTCDGQTDGQTRTEVRMGKIYEFLRSNIMTTGVTERRTLMTRVSRNVGH